MLELDFEMKVLVHSIWWNIDRDRQESDRQRRVLLVKIFNLWFMSDPIDDNDSRPGS